jgi:hypothetical protein
LHSGFFTVGEARDCFAFDGQVVIFFEVGKAITVDTQMLVVTNLGQLLVGFEFS